MEKFHNVQSISFDQSYLILSVDNQIFHFPISEISQKLAQASDLERKAYQVSPSGYGIHWSLIDEDLSIDGLLRVAQKIVAQEL